MRGSRWSNGRTSDRSSSFRTATFRWIGAAIGGYHDGENALADQLQDSFTPGILNLADRGFFSMHRWIRFSAAGAHLAWRIKNGAKSVPLKTIRTLPDGSELVMLRESDGMRTRRRRETGNPQAERLPDTVARLAAFTVTARTRGGRVKTTMMRVLTTLLDHEACPARDIAVLYAERWQIERSKPDCCHKRGRLSSSWSPSGSVLELAA